jgi:perosamine synthetase
MSQSRFIPVAHPVFAGNEKKYVNECLDTVRISAGRFIPLFEETFAKFCNVPYAVSCNNGTSALHLALVALGVCAGDEVIVPTLTYVATANSVRYCNATPVFVDSDPRTMNIDPARIAQRITSRTKGIIVVHLYGHPCDMDPIAALARKHNLFVLEDAAEAHGALYRGARVGGLGDAATFSFFGNKIVTTGEGGMVTTRDADLAASMRLLRGQGVDPNRRYWFPIVGHNFRMTNIEAAIGLAQMEDVEFHLENRLKVAGWYQKHLAGLTNWITLPTEEPWVRHAFWIYTVLLNSSNGIGRDGLMEALATKGIETRPVFYPMHVLPPYREPEGTYPVAEDLGRRGISLPAHGLLTEDDIAYIAQVIRGVCSSMMVCSTSGQ